MESVNSIHEGWKAGEEAEAQAGPIDGQKDASDDSGIAFQLNGMLNTLMSSKTMAIRMQAFQAALKLSEEGDCPDCLIANAKKF